MLIQINETLWCRTCNVVKVAASRKYAMVTVATRDSEEFHVLGEPWAGSSEEKAKEFVSALNDLDHP